MGARRDAALLCYVRQAVILHGPDEERATSLTYERKDCRQLAAIDMRS